MFRVTALSDTEATLDGNHPLAGRTVELRCEVLEVRAATQEDRARSRARAARPFIGCYDRARRISGKRILLIAVNSFSRSSCPRAGLGQPRATARMQ